MKISREQRHGELLIDNRLAPPEPGFPKFFEGKVYTCGHCQRQIILNPERVRERHWCSSCDSNVCDQCAVVMRVSGCKPFAAVIEDQLKRLR